MSSPTTYPGYYTIVNMEAYKQKIAKMEEARNRQAVEMWANEILKMVSNWQRPLRDNIIMYSTISSSNKFFYANILKALRLIDYTEFPVQNNYHGFHINPTMRLIWLAATDTNYAKLRVMIENYLIANNYRH